MRQLTRLIIVTALMSGSLLHAQEKYPVRQLTSDPAQEGFPCWSPDGKTIVYSLVERVDSTGRNGLWKIPAQGGKAWQFTDCIAEHPNWSPDGSYIVFDADSGQSIKLVSAHGGKPIRIVPESISVSKGGNPCWAPDAARFAFREGNNLYVGDIQTGQFEKIFYEEGILPIACCWSPDGRIIYVNLVSPESGASTLWLLSSTGERIKQLTFKKDNYYRYMDLSPDGSLLAFVSKQSENFDIWIMPAGGGAPIQLTHHPAYDDAPRWSPDGGKIAFTSTRSENFDVWVMELDVEKIKSELRTVNE
jgi:Tol biopolymer transport system component